MVARSYAYGGRGGLFLGVFAWCVVLCACVCGGGGVVVVGGARACVGVRGAWCAVCVCVYVRACACACVCSRVRCQRFTPSGAAQHDSTRRQPHVEQNSHCGCPLKPLPSPRCLCSSNSRGVYRSYKRVENEECGVCACVCVRVRACCGTCVRKCVVHFSAAYDHHETRTSSK